MIENVLIVDTETTGLDPSKGAKLIEVGAILYNVKHKAILQQFSTLFPCDENPVSHINGIEPEVTKVKTPRLFITLVLSQMVDHCQAIVAHNAQFDRKFLALIDPAPIKSFDDHRWICTKNDFKWPIPLFRNRLQDICMAMGVEYTEAHRALNDCTMIAKCFSKVNDLETRINRCSSSAVNDGVKFR